MKKISKTVCNGLMGGLSDLVQWEVRRRKLSRTNDRTRGRTLQYGHRNKRQSEVLGHEGSVPSLPGPQERPGSLNLGGRVGRKSSSGRMSPTWSPGLHRPPQTPPPHASYPTRDPPSGGRPSDTIRLTPSHTPNLTTHPPLRVWGCIFKTTKRSSCPTSVGQLPLPPPCLLRTSGGPSPVPTLVCPVGKHFP